MVNLIPGFFEKSISRLVTVSFIIVLLLPIGFFINSLYQNSWDQAEQSMLEKHHLIASSLVEPLNFFIASRQQSLHMVGANIVHALSDPAVIDSKEAVQTILDSHFRNFSDMVALSFAPGSDTKVDCVATNQAGGGSPDYPRL